MEERNLFGNLFNKLKTGLTKTRDGLTDKINEVLAGLSKEDRDAMMDQAVASQPVSN